MVVVLNGNLDGQACAVVPISSSDADDKGFSAKYHVPLPQEHFVVTSHYDIRDRWALADRIAVVSKERLFYIRGGGQFRPETPAIAGFGNSNCRHRGNKRKSLLQTEN